MSYFSYFYQLKASFNKFWYSNIAKAPKQEKTKLKSDVKLKCKRAALEVRNIENFTQWPITEAKAKQCTSLVYLDVTRKKRKQESQNNHIENKAVKVIDKSSLTSNVVVIKKLP